MKSDHLAMTARGGPYSPQEGTAGNPTSTGSRGLLSILGRQGERAAIVGLVGALGEGHEAVEEVFHAQVVVGGSAVDAVVLVKKCLHGISHLDAPWASAWVMVA